MLASALCGGVVKTNSIESSSLGIDFANSQRLRIPQLHHFHLFDSASPRDSSTATHHLSRELHLTRQRRLFKFIQILFKALGNSVDKNVTQIPQKMSPNLNFLGAFIFVDLSSDLFRDYGSLCAPP